MQLTGFSAVLDRAAPLIAPPFSDSARVLLLAVAGQESGWTARFQAGGGPARGYWQFESEAVVALFADPATSGALVGACAALDVAALPGTVYAAIAYQDVLAAVCARLLLWADPASLPGLGETGVAWDYYARNWRPGAPRPAAWQANYQAALAEVHAHGIRDG